MQSVEIISSVHVEGVIGSLTQAQPIEVGACTLNRFLHVDCKVAFAAEAAFGSARVRIATSELVLEFLDDLFNAVAVRHALTGPDLCLLQGFEISPQHPFLVLTVVFLVRKHSSDRCVEIPVQNGAETATSCVELFCMRC